MELVDYLFDSGPEMAVLHKCPQCQNKLVVRPDRFARPGNSVVCPSCSHNYVVTQADAASIKTQFEWDLEHRLAEVQPPLKN